MLPELADNTAAVLVNNATAFSLPLIIGQQCKRKSDLNTVIDLAKKIMNIHTVRFLETGYFAVCQ